jgi:hypothetical protein
MKLKIGNKEFKLSNDGNYHDLSCYIDYRIAHNVIYFHWQNRFAADCFYLLKFNSKDIKVDFNDFYDKLKLSLNNPYLDLSKEHQDSVIESIFDEKVLILL